jgi:hypothetical protein
MCHNLLFVKLEQSISLHHYNNKRIHTTIRDIPDLFRVKELEKLAKMKKLEGKKIEKHEALRRKSSVQNIKSLTVEPV